MLPNQITICVYKKRKKHIFWLFIWQLADGCTFQFKHFIQIMRKLCRDVLCMANRIRGNATIKLIVSKVWIVLHNRKIHETVNK